MVKGMVWIFYTLVMIIMVACQQPSSQLPTAALDSATPTQAPAISETAVNAQDNSDQPATTAAPTTVPTPTPELVEILLPDLPEGWTKIEPGGETRCAHNTDYAFWVRPGTVNKLIVFFQGGGGCWSGATCAHGSQLYDASVTDQDDPTGRAGIFDMDNLENPFRDYYWVFAPSCTGDIYMGTKEVTYTAADGGELVIHHKGALNGQAAVQWAFEHFSAPESIFVTGCSAGSIGSALFAPHLINHYPQTQVVQLGDSLGFLFDEPEDVDAYYGAYAGFPDWIPALNELAPADFTMARYYTAVANHYPDYLFSQFNTAADQVQFQFHVAGGEEAADFEGAIARAMDAIHADTPNFRSYIGEGTQHCILPRPDFYQRETNGVRFRDWVADLANGNDVPSIRCNDC